MVGRIGIAIARSNTRRLYAVVDAEKGGLYRSDDAGDSWTLADDDRRLWGRGSDFAEVKVDPKNPDVVYVANVCSYKSTDGGKHFTAWRGAPGGDDYHSIWINPENPQIILLASDQGAIVTVNGGETFSSWYNQPTAQFYHVITDNEFPYNVYGGQQESGSVGITSRGNDGQITFREWHPVGVEEYGYVAPDPLNPNLIYGGKLTRYDKRTGVVENVRPPQARELGARFLRTAPVIFSPVDPHVLYFAGNYLFRTRDGAKTWEVISPDLSRPQPRTPDSIGIYRTPEMDTMARRGVIYTVAPSYKDADVIWAGTDDGLIHLSQDGGRTWADVTPPDVDAWSKVSIIDAGRFDAGTAYAAINRFRLDDLRPHIYKTHDFGRTWTKIVAGLPDDPINAVREDPVRRGLLFCGSERAVYFSIDDGAHWNPLRHNMPATSIRDLVVHGDDVVVGTHGRSFWILDDIAALRTLAASSSVKGPILYDLGDAYQVEWNRNTDTPLPQEEPAGKNPPDGGIIDYYLPEAAKLITIEIRDQDGKPVRRFSSSDKPEAINLDDLQVPAYWIRPPQILSAGKGSHRFVWDLRLEPPPGRKGFPIAAIYGDTAPTPKGAWVSPGVYTVRLIVDGISFEKPMTIKPDPRVSK
jgi:photosystem II stability/assembly factor-like uncharacterized protein